ncbi:MAG TPA: hypothetical protein VIL21_02585 [Solirubrobacterales bacterium]
MRTLNILGLAVLATAAMAVCTGSASATTLTSPAGTTLKAGTELKASSEGAIQLHTVLGTRTCEYSNLMGELANQGGAAETVSVALTNLSFNNCSPSFTFTVLSWGKMIIHTDTASADGNGIVTWSGTTFTTVAHTIVGDFHCKYHINETLAGTLTGSKNLEGSTATLALESVELIPDKEYGWWYYCSEEEENEKGERIEKGPVLTGSYTFATPDYLDVD